MFAFVLQLYILPARFSSFTKCVRALPSAVVWIVELYNMPCFINVSTALYMSRAFVGIQFLAFIQGLIHLAANAPHTARLVQ